MNYKWEQLEVAINEFIVSEVGTMLPVDLSAIARSLGVVSIEPRPMKFDGYLARVGTGQYAVRYSASVSAVRQRFTIAHELGHLLLSKVTGQELTEPVSRDARRDSSEERLVDRIAAAILMPETYFATDLRKHRPSIQRLLWFQHRYRASQSAVRRRIRECRNVVGLELIACSATLDEAGSIAVRVSNGHTIRFFENPRTLVRDMIATGRADYEVALEVDGRCMSIPVFYNTSARNGGPRCYFLGWKVK